MSNIETPCPSCGNTTLFLDNTRRLVCTWIQCKQPVVQDKLNALAAELAAVKAERDEWKRKYDIVHDDPDYATCCERRDHWKQEAVWAARMVTIYVDESAGVIRQRAQAVLKEAGGE